MTAATRRATGRTKPQPHQRMKRAVIAPSKLPAAPTDFIPPTVAYGLFGNDEIGDCVIANLANTALQHAVYEGRALSFTDAEIRAFYFLLTGGPDSGLVETNALARVEEFGFPGDGRQRLACATAIDPANLAAVRSLCAAFRGLYVGAELPARAEVQLDAGQVWDVPPDSEMDDSDVPGSWSGHAMLLAGFTADGPLFGTWGKLQQGTWRWWGKNVDEAYITPSRERLIAEPTLAEILAVAVGEDGVA